MKGYGVILLKIYFKYEGDLLEEKPHGNGKVYGLRGNLGYDGPWENGDFTNKDDMDGEEMYWLNLINLTCLKKTSINQTIFWTYF